MKNTWVKTFAVIAIASLVVIGCGLLELGNGLVLLAMPFVLIGQGLRALSLSGTGGNVAAIVLYGIVCLLPLLPLFREKWRLKDLLLPVCSGVMFYVIYYMINPSYRPVILQGEQGDVIFAETVYSILLSWLILTMMESREGEGKEHILDSLRMILLLCMAVFGVSIISSVSGLVSSIKEIRDSNTAPGIDLVPTYVFTVLHFGVVTAEYILDIFVLRLARRLLQHLKQDPYSEACCNASSKLAGLCKATLITVVLSGSALNVGQLLLADFLHNVSVGIHIPVVSIALVYALLALTRLLHQGKELKEDNDLFV